MNFVIILSVYSSDTFLSLGGENSPALVSLKASKPDSVVVDMYGKKPGGVIATINVECNEHLRTLHKQLLKVLKGKPSQCPNDAGSYFNIPYLFFCSIHLMFFFLQRN